MEYNAITQEQRLAYATYQELIKLNENIQKLIDLSKPKVIDECTVTIDEEIKKPRKRGDK